MNIKDIHLGDRLRVRQWDDMAAEFGYDEEGGGILCDGFFNDKMQCLCGLSFTVAGVDGDTVTSAEGIERVTGADAAFRHVWFLFPDMLEPDDAPPERPLAAVDYAVFEHLLGGDDL